MVTMEEIARALNVNKATVSKALRNSPDLNAQTAHKIRAEARRMGYVQRPRKNGAVCSVGVVLPELVSGFYSRIGTTVAALLDGRGFESVFSVSGFDATAELQQLQRFRTRGFAGAILISENVVLSAQMCAFLRQCDIPVVQIASNAPEQHVSDCVCIDERAGIQATVTHLAALGHRRIAFVGDPVSRQRRELFCTAMAEQGLPVPDDCCITVNSRHYTCGYMGADRLPKDVTAVFAAYDDVAVGLMRRLEEQGRRVPADVSVIGFDDADYCAYLPVGLTTVHSHEHTACETAVDMLSGKLADPSRTAIRRVVIRPDLVVRESTAAPKTANRAATQDNI